MDFFEKSDVGLWIPPLKNGTIIQISNEWGEGSFD